MSKIDTLFTELTEWRTVEYLTALMSWQPHTLRAAIATSAKKRGVEIERKREDGLTSYRIKPDDYNPRDDLNKSVNECYRAIKERVANGGPGWEPGS